MRERMPGQGDYERFPFENVLGDPRVEDYLKMPCQNDRCGCNDPAEIDSGCTQFSKHSVSLCAVYQPESRFEKMDMLERENERLQKENERLRRIVKTWADEFRESMELSMENLSTWRMAQ